MNHTLDYRFHYCWNYIYNNVFENLNNQIIPIGSNNNESGNQGYGSITGGHSTNHIGGNLFYYNPSPIENYVPLGNMISEQSSNNVGQVAYQMPTFYNDSIILNSNRQYIFNTSTMTKDNQQYARDDNRKPHHGYGQMQARKADPTAPPA